MKLKKKLIINSNDNYIFKYFEPNITALNKTFETSLTTKHSKAKSRKNVVSLNSFTNAIKLKIKNNKNLIIYKKNKNSFNLKNNVNNKNNQNKFKTIKIITNNNDINKLLINSSYSHSLNKKEQYNNNSLNIMGLTNIKESFYPINEINEIHEKNKLYFKKGSDIKKNSFSLKNHFSILKNKIKFKENRNKTLNILNEKDNMEQNYFENRNLTEENKENTKFHNLSNIFVNNNVDNKKLIRYIKKNNNEFYENEFNLENKDNLTKDEISLLIKKYNILLEEKHLYKKKIIILQKENKKLKEEKKLKNKDNNFIKEENEILKKQIIFLKNKINELIGNNNSNNIIKDKIDETHMSYLNSFCSSINRISNPTTEIYIKKLEKENEELSNRILNYKKMFKFSQK